MSSASDHDCFLGLEISLGSAKVRPALCYKQVHFVEERSNIEEIRKRTGFSSIPVVVTPEGETWQDTSVILDLLEARHPEPPLFPPTPVQRLSATLVELYADEFSAIPAMHTRWGTP